MICLSWPARCLHPNDRTDRRKATAARIKARMEGWAEVHAKKHCLSPDAHLVVTFCPPDARRRDLDGLFASIKPHLDGMASAARVDDAGWTFTLLRGDPVKGGAVLVKVSDQGWRQIGDIARDMVKGTVA